MSFNRDLEAFAPACAGHYHPLNDLADDLFALGHRRRRGMPQGRDVVREVHNGLSLCRRERARLRLHNARILFLQVPVRSELVFPLLSELAGHQAMFGLD